MRLRTLLIERYGNLDRADLTFDPAPGRLNLLLAPNGAGKSVLRRAFHDLLFGIPLQSDMRFRFDYAGMHLRADAVSQEGTEYAFGWHRRAGRIYPSAAGDSAASRWLTELLDAITPRQVEMLFALDTERLRSGGRDLAAGDSTLGSALLSGTGELASARALRRGLDEKRAAIWERSKSSRPLNAALSRLTAAAKQRREAVQTPKSLATLQAALEDTRRRKDQAAADAASAQAALSRLNRIELTRGPVSELAAATSWLAGHGDAPILPEGLGEELARARHEASLAATRLESARQQLADAEARAAAAGRDAAADAAEPELAKLPGALGDAATKRRDIAIRTAERSEALLEVAAALRDIGSSIPPDQAGSAIPTLAAVTDARAQIGQHTAAATTRALAQTRLEKAEADLASLAAEAAATPLVAPEGLEALLAEIRRIRDPVDHAAELAAATRQAAAAERACLATLPGWTGDAAELAALTPSTEAAYERMADAVRRSKDRRDKAAAEHGRLLAQRSAWEASLAALRQRTLPDAAALAAARANRDRGWRLIYARAFAAAPDDAEERAYTAGEALPIVFERHLRAADAMADARFEETARVEQAALLTADLTGSDAAWEAANAAMTLAEAAHADAVRQWGEACAALRLPPDTSLREVTALLTARAEMIEARRRTELARGAEQAVASLHAAWAARLAMLLDAAPVALAALLPMADAKLKAATSAQTAAVTREARRAQAEADRHAAAGALTAAEAKLAQWRVGWEQTLLALGRPPGEAPGVTERVLGRLGELDRHHRTAVGLQARIVDMQADIASFTRIAATAAAKLGMQGGDDPFALAEALIIRRDRARSLVSVAQEAASVRIEAMARVQEAVQRHREAAASLAATLAACGAEDVAAAECRIDAARERRRQEVARDKATLRLREIGRGASLETLVAELAALPPERFEAERLAAESALTLTRQEEQEAAVALAELERRFAADAAATAASEAAAGEAAIAAEAGRLLDEYLLLRVASGMLGRALDRVEESAGLTGIQRIAAAFEAITDGAWTVTAGENAKGETILRAAERAANEPSKLVDQLSEGTRDQLYLALRLVAIETHVATAPPLPFIADDILQTFDDGRARAAMRALVGLSQHVQVIVLTHHPHVLALAEGLPVHVQRL